MLLRSLSRAQVPKTAVSGPRIASLSCNRLAARSFPALSGSHLLSRPPVPGVSRLSLAMMSSVAPSTPETPVITNNIPQTIVERIGRGLHLQQHHPINIIKKRMETFFSQTYKDQSGKPIFKFFDNFHPRVTTQQNFDDLLVPKDHVSRRPTDTFYYDGSHCLRTHTSAHQTQLLRAGTEAFLVTADCYRRDEIDSSHYPIFHQMEGVRVFPASVTDISVVEKDLKSALEGVTRSLLGDVQVRWVDAYFPFTTPSFELEAFFEGRWLEVLGCGVIHPDIMKSVGLGAQQGWAFGIGIERLAMVLFDVPDIRLFWSKDERFLSQFNESKLGNKFQPFSKYPHISKDISFWFDPKSFHENDFCAIVRNTAGDVVEKVSMVDEFVHPKTGRASRCYRVTYRSMERSLTHEEIDSLQEAVRAEVGRQKDVQLR